MATTPTQLPVPSEKPQDLKFNAGKIDEFVTSQAMRYMDRHGRSHYTIDGIIKLATDVITGLGFIFVDSFQDGASITSINQALHWKKPDGDGEYYRWDGALPKPVPSGSTPESAGGIGPGAWVGVGDAALRSMLASSEDGMGDELVAFKQSASGSVDRTVHDKLGETKSLKDFDAFGDGVSDDTAAVQKAFDWLSSAPNQTLKVTDGIYPITSATITMSGLSTQNCKVISEGAFKHLSTTGDMITVRESMFCEYEFNIIGAGFDPLTIPNYSTPDPTNCQQAILFNSNRGCKLKIKAVGYPGRVLRTKSTGSVKLSFMDLKITTGNDTCGQAMYLQGAADAWGCISFANTNWDYYGSVLDTMTDVSVVYWEAGSKGSGSPAVTFKGLQNSHITTIAVGQDRTNSALFVDGGRAITIQKALLGESTYGLEVVGSGTGQPIHQLTIHSLLCANVDTAAVRLSNAVGVTINDHIFDGCPYDVMFFNLARDIIIKGHHRNPTAAALYGVASSTLENVKVSGKFYTAGSSSFADLRLSDTTNVVIEDQTIITQGYYLRLKDSSNGVTVRGGNWSATLLPLSTAIEFSPRTIRDVTGINTRKTASAQTIPSGSASGTTITVPHGLYRAPNEIDVRVRDPSNTVTAGNNTVLVSTVDATNIVFKYFGSSALTSALNFNYTAKCEERSN